MFPMGGKMNPITFSFRHLDLTLEDNEIVMFQRSIDPESEQDQEIRIPHYQAVMVAKWILMEAKRIAKPE